MITFQAQTIATFFLDWLIHNGCPINRANNKGETAIFRAVLKGNFQLIQSLVNYEADSNICETDNGFSPLYMACLKGDKRIAICLLKSGANCNIISTKGDAPLHAACCNGHASLVTELLKFNADLSIKNNNGFTPLNLALHTGHFFHITQKIMDTLDS